VYPTWIKNKKIVVIRLADMEAKARYTLMRVRTICPALIFAARRKESVIGRTRVLAVSIRIKKGFSHAGAPPGKREASVVDGLNLALERISLSHRGRPRTRVKKRCEEELKI